MKTFKQHFGEQLRANQSGADLLLEYECYKLIPGTSNSYREDPANTSTKSDKHAHTYARPKGGGKELYAVTIQGRGHDGSHGVHIPEKHANYFRSKGYKIKADNVLESRRISQLPREQYEILFE